MTHDEMVKQIASICDVYMDGTIAAVGATQLILGITKQREETLEAELDAARAECNTLWAYVRSGFAIAEHEENCEVCGLNEMPCDVMNKLKTENMRGFNTIMALLMQKKGAK